MGATHSRRNCTGMEQVVFKHALVLVALCAILKKSKDLDSSRQSQIFRNQFRTPLESTFTIQSLVAQRIV